VSRDPEHFRRLEEHLARLMPEVADVLSTAEAPFAYEYMEAAEYGLALETIVDDLCMRRAPISRAVYREFVVLFDLMDDLVDDRLSAFLQE
jgi:hypothetical protein